MKYSEKEGKKSSGNNSCKDIKKGYYNAEHVEDDSYDTWITDYKEKQNFGGSVGRPTGEER